MILYRYKVLIASKHQLQPIKSKECEAKADTVLLTNPPNGEFDLKFSFPSKWKRIFGCIQLTFIQSRPTETNDHV